MALKELRFFCGPNRIRVEGEAALVDALSIRREYIAPRGQDAEDVVLRLAEGLAAESGGAAEGWSLQNVDTRPQAVYFREGRPAFSLRREPTGEVTVLLADADAGYARMALQYGMMLALCRQCVGLHGVTLLCGDEVVILSAPSGTGKTTLARLLEEHVGAITVNGDFALLSFSEEGVIFEPTPFCGSSGRCLNHRLRVDRIVFLEQAAVSAWRGLSGREALRRFMNNSFVPVWDGALQRQVQENAMKCISALEVNAFAFAPTREAAELFYHNLRFF